MAPSRQRLKRLAEALCMTPGDDVRLELSFVNGRRQWWLCGCIGGDAALPQTGNASTEEQALEQAEAWLAVELDRKAAGG